jgi:hypothetical protein
LSNLRDEGLRSHTWFWSADVESIEGKLLDEAWKMQVNFGITLHSEMTGQNRSL